MNTYYYEILANKAFIVVDGLISQLFVVAFVISHICTDSPHSGLSSAT